MHYICVRIHALMHLRTYLLTQFTPVYNAGNISETVEDMAKSQAERYFKPCVNDDLSFLLESVTFLLFLSNQPRGHSAQPILTQNGSNDVDSRTDVPFVVKVEKL